MKCYIIAGEDSGDLHGANLVRAMQAQKKGLMFKGVGGEQMKSAGVELVAHVKDINFMGFWEVITNLGTIRKLFKTVKADLQNFQPDCVILIDYPGFNLRIAKFISTQLHIPVYYYISPQVWAWKKGRVKKIKRYTERMLTILPFEKDFYAKEGLEVDFVGHPLLDVIPPLDKRNPDPKLIAILPGSRKQEIKRMLPVMLEVANRMPEFRYVIAGAPSQTAEFYQSFIQNYPHVELWENRTYELLEQAQAAMVTSGTATLETALFGVPEVVCYKGGALSYWIGKRLVEIEYIGLVNLIPNEAIATELIQHDFTADRLEAEMEKLLYDENMQQHFENAYQRLREILGDSGASERAAEIILAGKEGEA